MRKLFTIETSSENEWNEVLKSVQESINDSSFIGFEISVACRIYNSNAFREWLDTLTAECNNSDFYHCWELDNCVKDFSGSFVGKKIVFSKEYYEEIDVVREQRNDYARRVEELEEALKEYEYGVVPELKEKCKNQAKEITCLRKKIENLNDETKALKEKQLEIVWDRDTVIKQLEKDKAELLERNKRLMNDNVILKTKYEMLKEKQKNGRYPLGVPNVSKSVNDYRINVVVDQVNDVIHIINKTFDEVNKKFNETDSKLNDIAEHLQELDKFRNSIKKEGDIYD